MKEKKTEEKYSSKSAMKKTPPTKQLAKHDMGRKTSAAKMKKC